ncbi:MAG TPA: polyphenol oxidase family protein [Gaiellaceae bacterium]
MIRWEAPGPYEVAFSTRVGGVSGGAYKSLNLGARTKDDPRRVAENRRRLCAAVGADGELAAMAFQRHGAEIARARPRGILAPGTRFEACDALWSDEPGQAMLVLTADCLPVALARRNGATPALAIVHVGWRGLLAGVLEAAVRTLGPGPLAAGIGPAIGPCCYRVGEDVAEPFRARFGAGVLEGGKLDLWRAGESALREAGCELVERLDLCTSCRPELFFSHRRDGGVTGRQGLIGYVA